MNEDPANPAREQEELRRLTQDMGIDLVLAQERHIIDPTTELYTENLFLVLCECIRRKRG